MSIKKQSEQQIYGRNDMIMLEQNNKIYGSLGLADRYVMKTEEGTRLILSNPKLGSFDDVLTEFNIYGMSKQVTTTGAQLLNIEPKETTVENGIVYRINYDGTIELSGTATVNTYILVATLDESLDGKTAFLSGAVTDKVFIGITDLEDDGTTVADLGDGASFTFVENGTTKYVGISVNSGTTVNNIIKPMLNLGTTAKPWEKYTGGMPAPNPEYPQEIVSVGESGSIGVEITGKNLMNPYFKKSTTVNGITCVPNGDGTYTLNGTATKKADFIVFTISKISSSSLFGKTLKIVGCPSGGNRESKYALYLQRQVAPNYTPIIADEGNGSSSLEINDSVDGAYSSWTRIHSGYTCNNLVFKPMITTDLSATYDDFEPYKQPQSFTITTPTGLPAIPVPSGTSGITYTDADRQAWIADEIDFSRGKYIQRVWQAEFDGSEDEKWVKEDTKYLYIVCLPVNMNDRKGFCNQYIVGNDIRGIKIGNGTKALIVFDDFSDENALSNFKAHLASNPLVVMTYLDTPIETDLTEAQIQAYKSLTTFKPTTIISNNAECHMKLTYKATGN